MFDLRNLLGVPRLYRTFQDLVGGDSRRRYVNDYIRPEPGMRILDIGCGPGDILRHFDSTIEYTGVDLSPQYIAHARHRFGSRGRFLNQSVSQLAVAEPRSFDRVLANGLIHHLCDADARHLLAVARESLAPGGLFISLDGCFDPGQSRLARFVLGRDRGEFVRDRPGYLELAREVFPRVESDLRHDMLRIPYTHLIMTCPAPADVKPSGRKWSSEAHSFAANELDRVVSGGHRS